MVLTGPGERVRPGDLAPAPPAGQLQQGGDRDLLVREAGTAVGVAVHGVPRPGVDVEVRALEVAVEPGLAPDDGCVERPAVLPGPRHGRPDDLAPAATDDEVPP